MRPLDILCVVGARPNFVKIAPIMREIASRSSVRAHLVHTGQHCSPEMSQTFFHDLEIPEPEINLDARGGSHATQTAEVMMRVESVLKANRPDVVLVLGDVNSTMATALVASKMGIPVAHVEAGLRSFDRRMPEEINRIVTDSVSDLLFTSEPVGQRNLAAEGIPKEKIFFVGNVMIDTLLRFRQKAQLSDVLKRLELCPGNYAVVTLHRPSNVDDPERVSALMEMIGQLATSIPVVFPVHPRTRANLPPNEAPARLILTEPLGYLDFLRLLADASVVLTDSGGIQEETTILQIPCITLRENTERPITIEQGTNRLVGLNPNAALCAAREALQSSPMHSSPPPLWDGRASERIIDIIEQVV